MDGSLPAPLREDDEPLGAYLQRMRLARGVPLDTISARTKIKQQLFDELERGDLRNWPTGRFYIESHLRAYAAAIGLEPKDVVERYRREVNPPPEPPPDTPVPPVRPKRSLRLAVPAVFATTFAVSFLVAHSQWRQPPGAVEQGAIGMTGVENADSPMESTAPLAIELAPAAAPEPVIEAATEEPRAPVANRVEGELVIDSTPSAYVTVNGFGRGDTPLRVQFLPPGSYTVRFVATGYGIEERKVSISAERPRAEVSVSLTPRSSNVGSAR